MNKGALLLVLAGAALTLRAQAPAPKPQPPEPTPAFAGQTDAPPPAQRSPALDVRVVADGLTGAWAVAVLPDGRYLVTQSAGQMRIVSADGKLSAPIAGVPGVKTVAAQGLHDVLLDPQFASNRLIYFTYFAPPKGQEPRNWPIEHFYEEVWTKPLAERRTMQLV
jgi:glucose/arabinose dehydrogenase